MLSDLPKVTRLVKWQSPTQESLTNTQCTSLPGKPLVQPPPQNKNPLSILPTRPSSLIYRTLALWGSPFIHWKASLMTIWRHWPYSFYWILPIQEVTKKIRVGLTKFACIDFSAPDSPPLVVRMSSFLLVQGKYFSCGTSSSSFQKEKESQSVLIPAISSRL